MGCKLLLVARSAAATNVSAVLQCLAYTDRPTLPCVGLEQMADGVGSAGTLCRVGSGELLSSQNLA